MQFILGLLNRRPNTLEAYLLSQLAESLEPSAGAILRAQTASINRVRRLASGREVLFYRVQAGRPDWRGVELFALRELETLFATATFNGLRNEKLKYAAEFWLVQGHIFSIIFSAPPGKARRPADIVLQSLTVHVDPMKSAVRPQEQQSLAVPSLDALTGWIAEWHEMYGVRDLRPPHPPEVRAAELQALNTLLPEDYTQSLAHTDGFLAGKGCIFGVHDIYEAHLESGDFLIIAEIDAGGPNQGFLAVKRRSTTREVFHVPHECRQPQRLGKSLRLAMEGLLEEELKQNT